MKRVALIVLTIAVFLLFTAWLQAEEIKPPRITPPPIKVTFDELADIPFDIAKNFPADAYYFWALAHNAKASGHPTPATPPVLQTTTSGFSPGITFRGRGRVRAGQYNQQTTVREFREQVGSGPVTLYNPYFRLDPK